jgi:hypothetical protein
MFFVRVLLIVALIASATPETVPGEVCSVMRRGTVMICPTAVTSHQIAHIDTLKVERVRFYGVQLDWEMFKTNFPALQSVSCTNTAIYCTGDRPKIIDECKCDLVEDPRASSTTPQTEALPALTSTIASIQASEPGTTTMDDGTIEATTTGPLMAIESLPGILMEVDLLINVTVASAQDPSTTEPSIERGSTTAPFSTTTTYTKRKFCFKYVDCTLRLLMHYLFF